MASMPKMLPLPCQHIQTPRPMAKHTACIRCLACTQQLASFGYNTRTVAHERMQAHMYALLKLGGIHGAWIAVNIQVRMPAGLACPALKARAYAALSLCV